MEIKDVKTPLIIASAVVITASAFSAVSSFFSSRIRGRKGERYPDESLISSPKSLLHNKFSPAKLPEDIDVIVIGSGMGGLSCASVLARLGRKVLVLEQHPDVAGGGSHTFDLKGYRFDSGLHYTVPWSVPVFALTCLKKPKNVTPFKIMGEADGTVDKIYLEDPAASKTSQSVTPFNMKYKETHMEELYRQFPDERKAIDEFIRVSNDAMAYVKVFIGLRLLPRWLQEIFWRWFVPRSLIDSAAVTAKELLPKLTSNKRLISLLSSMWIDTGARPDKATFMLTASVFRGISMEGGCYPSGGSEALARELVPVIEKYGGKVFIRAPVQEILIERGRAVGVKMADKAGTVIRAKEAVVSSAGYVNTFKHLVAPEWTSRAKIPRELSVPQSAGFVMANLGICDAPENIGITNTNTWHIPVTADGDAFLPLEEFFTDPLGVGTRMPAFITFPSVKDIEWSKKNPNKTSCQILLMAEYAWFEKFRGATDEDRVSGYNELKQIWTDKCLEIFFKYFPKCKGKVDFVDLSTPLTIEHYLRAEKGGAVGIDVTPERFIDPIVRQNLDARTKIPGLFLTGQDIIICGVTLCQLSGVITAVRMAGFWAGAKILAQSILLGN